jgi:hypothetical protein
MATENGITYVGSSDVPNAANSAAVWNIWAIAATAGSGNITATQALVANVRLDALIWNSRATYFPGLVPAFVNNTSVVQTLTSNRLSLLTGAQHPFNFLRTNSFTLSGWFRATSLLTVGFFAGTKVNTGTAAGWALWHNAGGTITFDISSSGSSQLRVTTTAPAIATNMWYHISVTYNGSSTPGGVVIRVNDSAQGLTTNINTLTTNPAAQPFDIGSNSAGGNTLFGYMDEVSIWNTALSGTQNTAIYNSGTPGNLASLAFYNTNIISWWRMGDGAIYPLIPDVAGPSTIEMIGMSPANFSTLVP